MKAARGAALWLAVLAGAGGLIAWNHGRFIGAEAKVREKDLDFLPTPIVARVLAMGHSSTVAKLRWIDSFAYFQYQLDRRDDSVPGEGAIGGFERLYDTLIELDPKFVPFYEHAGLCTSGLLKQDRLALGYYLRGTLELPHESIMWRNAAATLYADFDLGERDPAQFERFLDAWDQAELDQDGRLAIRIWMQNLTRRKFARLEQLPAWFERLRTVEPGTPIAEFTETTIREQLADYAVSELQALAAASQLWHGGVATSNIASLGDPLIVNARYGNAGPPDYMPLIKDDTRDWYALLADPWGSDFAFVDGAVISPGRERGKFDLKLNGVNAQLQQQRRDGKPAPTSIADLAERGVAVPTPPPGTTLAIVDGEIVAHHPKPDPNRAYPVREIAENDLNEQRAAFRQALRARPR